MNFEFFCFYFVYCYYFKFFFVLFLQKSKKSESKKKKNQDQNQKIETYNIYNSIIESQNKNKKLKYLFSAFFSLISSSSTSYFFFFCLIQVLRICGWKKRVTFFKMSVWLCVYFLIFLIDFFILSFYRIFRQTGKICWLFSCKLVFFCVWKERVFFVEEKSLNQFNLFFYWINDCYFFISNSKKFKKFLEIWVILRDVY